MLSSSTGDAIELWNIICCNGCDHRQIPLTSHSKEDIQGGTLNLFRNTSREEKMVSVVRIAVLLFTNSLGESP